MTTADVKMSFCELFELCTDPCKLQLLRALHADGRIDLDLQGHNGNTMLHILCDWANQNKKHDEAILTMLKLGAYSNHPGNKSEHVINLTTRLDVGMLLIRFGATYESINPPPEHYLFSEEEKTRYSYFKRAHVLLALFNSQIRGSKSPLHFIPGDVLRRIKTYL